MSCSCPVAISKQKPTQRLSTLPTTRHPPFVVTEFVFKAISRDGVHGANYVVVRHEIHTEIHMP